jgi:NADPH:quinone reductase-like Zn-dependent oxidoreductase/acyl carrier protein
MRSCFDERTREYSVYSCSDGDSVEWTLHARGRIAAAAPLVPKRIALDDVRHRCSEEIPRETLYERLIGHGMRYGPSFQRIERVWRSDGQALALLKPLEPADSSGKGYRLHPALLDGSIQCLAAAVRPDRAALRAYLPVGIRRVMWTGRTSTSWWSYAQIVEQSDIALEANIVVCDDQGGVLAELTGVRCQPLPSSDRFRAELDTRTYRPEWLQADRPASSAGASRWLILADDSGYGERLARDLMVLNGGVNVDVVSRRAVASESTSRSSASSSFSRILSERRGIERVVHLWPLDDPDPAADPSRCDAVVDFLHLVQAVAEQGESAPRLYVVTRGAQSVDDEAVSGLAHAPVIGLARTALTEHPSLRCTVIDLDPGWTPQTSRELACELVSDSAETEVALRDAGRFVYRLARFSMQAPKPDANLEPMLTAADAGRFCLRIGTPGRLETLGFHQIRREPPQRNEVEIRVLAAALNFKDVLKATGFLPAQAIERTYHLDGLGMEAAGVISAVGEGVHEYHVGDAVVGSVPNSFSSHVTVPVGRLFAAPKLETMSFVEAASVPVAFMTAYYALHELAQLRAGETVLIHAAAGGVGLAALQVARWLGAAVIATAGSEEKRAYVRSLGVEQVLNSRTLDFADEVMALTGGRGVDVVLNSLPGEALLKSVSVVAPLGRFVEIGKRDIVENALLPMAAFNRNLSFIAIDLDRIMAEQPDRIRALFERIWERFRVGDFTPTRMEVFPASEVSEAFRRMAQSKQIGKIVISFEDLDGVTVVPETSARSLLRAGASYLITGGCGGFGLEVAKWMASNGARHLVLAGRTGARTVHAQEVVRGLQAQGVEVRVCSSDVSDETQLTGCLSSIGDMPPLRGIVHAAGILDDAIMVNLDEARLLRVMAPKARGAWLLHTRTRHLSLDFFVLFSSVSSLVGTPGQGNYVAANAYLDALAHHRRAIGLPATSINWGALADVGMAAEDPQGAARLARVGITPIAPNDAVRSLALALETNIPQVGIIDANWQRWRQFCGSATESPKFVNLLEPASPERAGASGRLRAALTAAPPAERPDIAVRAVVELISETLRMSAEKVDLQAPLTEMGIDSLMALELQLAIETRFGLRCSVLELQKAHGIRGLAQRLVSQMGLSTEAVN